MLNKSFEMGIPHDYAFKQLFYHPAVRMLIVQVQPIHTKKWLPDRLYYRALNDGRYRPVGAPLPMMAQEYPVISLKRPILVYNATQYSYTRDAAGEEHLGGDWDSLKIYDLETHQFAQDISRQTLKVPADVTRYWISSLLCFSQTEEVLYLTVGLSQKGEGRMDYYLAGLDIETRVLRVDSPLPAAFM